MFSFLKHKAARGVCINVVTLHQQAIYFWFKLPKTLSMKGMFHFSASLFPHLVYLTIYLWISVNTASPLQKKRYFSTSVRRLFFPQS
jgi:hypothetical protein